VLFAAFAAGAGAWGGAALAGILNVSRFHDELILAGAIVVGILAYGAVVVVFRRVLPLGRLAGAPV
jgi:hypothetical protein